MVGNGNFKPKLEKQSKNKNHSEKIYYIFSKKVFLILREMELSSPKIKKFQMELFELDKQKKKNQKELLRITEPKESHSEKMFYILGNETF